MLDSVVCVNIFFLSQISQIWPILLGSYMRMVMSTQFCFLGVQATDSTQMVKMNFNVKCSKFEKPIVHVHVQEGT